MIPFCSKRCRLSIFIKEKTKNNKNNDNINNDNNDNDNIIDNIEDIQDNTNHNIGQDNSIYEVNPTDSSNNSKGIYFSI
jgi:hypothetical protein